MQAGDEFTGRCICLLNMMSSNFASSPVFFAPDTDEDWIKMNVGEVFPHFEAAEGMGHILWMCLASIVNRRDKVLGFDQITLPEQAFKCFGILPKCNL
jgi:hypothetical protein